MVLVSTNGGAWTAMAVGRDYLGSIIAVANGCKFTFKGFMYFNAGFGIGALSAVGAQWAAGVTKAAGVWGGALIGAGTGAATGAASSYLSNGVNNLIGGHKFSDNWQSSLLSGAISGAMSGAISGGIDGYKFAKEQGANPWTNEFEETIEKFDRPVKEGIPPQLNSKEYCYGTACAYADYGHGNHSAEEFIAASDYRKGADVSALKKLSGTELVGQGGMRELTKNVREIGRTLFNNRHEMLATIPGIDGKKHWVNIYQIIASSRLALFGGKTVFTPNTISFWNPATGLTESTSSILDFKVFRF